MFKFNELNNWEKAGLIIGGIEALVGLGMYVYGTIEYKRLTKQISEDEQQVKEQTNELLNKAGFTDVFED